jgi:flavin reductase (DIM6/NTAB) family NADH-FMN oxidoreductase RutF
MTLRNIPVDSWQVKPHDLWENQALLLTAGNYMDGKYNCMTVGWGSFGTMWSRPFAMVVVRPQRYTFEFMETFETFTLCAFPEKYRPALNLLGSKSGRDGNKIEKSGLTVISSKQVAAPSFLEANLVIECNKVYWQDMNPEHFLAEYIHKKYPNSDYHRIYFGEIISISGDDNFKDKN